MTSKKDERFNKISDPKFKEIPKKIKKVEIKDSRFTSMFTNKKFNEGLEKNDLKRYYMIEDENHENLIDDDPEIINDIENEYESDTSEEFENYLAEQEIKNTAEDPFEVIEEKDIPSGEETNRLSVMNIDWQSINANDLFVLFSSFCKGKAKIEKVEIYPSEYGIKEMEREKIEGPSKDIFLNDENKENKKKKKNVNNYIKNMDDLSEEDNNNHNGLNPLKLRKYELKKLKYYYGIVYCNSKQTAFSIYKECDGMEIERTQNFMDIRFVPDSLQEFPFPPKEICTTVPPEYIPNFYSNSALQHSDVKLTWETNNPKRNELISKAFSKDQFNEKDIKELLMSSDSETDEDLKIFKETLMNGNNASEDLNLLKRKREKETKYKEGETIEISFNKGLEGINDKIMINKNISNKDKSTWESYLEKKKNIRRDKKIAERNEKEQRKSKNLNTKATKKELNLLIDESLENKKINKHIQDNRFEAIGKDSKFAIDPTSREYKNLKKK